jgi:aldose 1-epimerase
MKMNLKLTFSNIMAMVVLLGFVSCGGGSSKKPEAGIVKESCGQFKGQDVDCYTLTNHSGVSMKVLSYGGTISELYVPDKNGQIGNVVLGFDGLAGYVSPEYEKSNPNFGALIGRYGNRIAKGKFSLTEVESAPVTDKGGDQLGLLEKSTSTQYTLATNNGENHLHGGNIGFNRVVWAAKEKKGETENSLELTYMSEDMEEGYPGNLNVTVLYTLTDNNELIIDYAATTDKATPCNLTNHSYFNLSAGKQPTILNHEVTILADQYTEVDGGLIPTGSLPPVEGTPMDFTTPHKIGERIDADFEQLKLGRGYDHNWVLRNSTGSLALAATVYEPESGRYMEVLTTEPGVQFYTGNFLDGTLTGPNNIKYVRRSGLCLETQHFPDSPNQPSFPSTILRPGETYSTKTIYKFSVK